jgi:PAS domain S-box-containing protein
MPCWVTAVPDMAKEKQAVEEAQLIAAVVEFSDDAIIGSTLGGIVTSWNPAAERLYGYSCEEIVGKSGNLLAPEGRASQMSDVLVRVRDGETVERLETTLVRKDGTVVPVSLTVAPIRDEDGATVGLCAIHRDVTEQGRAFDVAQRMEAIIESSDDAIIALTLEGVVTSWNPAAERLFGYTTEEIIGKPAETVTPKDRPEEMKDVLAKVKAGQHIDHLETIRVRKDGSVFPVSLTVSPICDADGAIVGTSMISRNMTELKHAVRYARSLIEAAVDPLVTISPEGEITDVNEASIRVTGVPRGQLIGTGFSQHFTDPDKAHEGYQRAFEQGSLIDYPLTLIHTDGTMTDVLYNASVYRDFNDNVLGVVAVARDAAQLRQQQQRSGQLQEALESRIVIEQAKGITAQRHGLTIDQAYQRMRTHARRNNASLRTVAEAIVEVGLKV